MTPRSFWEDIPTADFKTVYSNVEQVYKPQTITLKWDWLTSETPQQFTQRVLVWVAQGYKAKEAFVGLDLAYFQATSARLKALMKPITSVEVVLCRQ